MAGITFLKVFYIRHTVRFRLRETDQFFLMKGADTVVTLGGVIYEKPADEPDAVRILEQLSGRSHSVYTGVQLIYSTCGQTSRQRFYEVTEVVLFILRMRLIFFFGSDSLKNG